MKAGFFLFGPKFKKNPGTSAPGLKLNLTKPNL